MKYHFTLVRTVIIKKSIKKIVERVYRLSILLVGMNWYSHYGEQFKDSFKN